MENLQGLDYERLQAMSDDEMKGLLDLVNRLKPEDKGDVSGGIGNAMDNLDEIKGVIGGLRDNYGLDTEKLLDSILKERYWVLEVQDDQGGGFYGIVRWRRPHEAEKARIVLKILWLYLQSCK